MKYLSLVLLFSSIASAAPKYELIPLHSPKKSSLKLGTVTATLNDLSTGKQLVNFSGELGDCETCTRGVAVKGLLGVRVEGKTVRSLKIGHKQSPAIKLIKCDEYMFLITRPFSCEFIHNNQKLKLTVKTPLIN